MHNSRQLFVIFALSICMAQFSAVSAASDMEKHRTPFIVPISPPQFGATPSLPAKASAETHLSRNEWLVVRNATFETPAVPEQNLYVFPTSEAVKLESHPWASHVQWNPQSDAVAESEKPKNNTQSKVVGISRPNATVLNDRITVHNLNVAAMEDQLRIRESWTLEEIESAYDQLTSIEENRRIWSMYFDLLEPRSQRRIGSPMSLSKCKELLRQRVFETQVTLEINRFAVTKLDSEAARSRLEELSNLLQE